MRILFFLLGFSLSIQAAAAELIWKRSQILERDLSRALELSADELCLELGQYSCLKDVHLYALGDHDPFARVQYRSLPEPSQLSAIAFERVVLNACINRIARDGEGAAPTVFRFYPLQQKLSQLNRPAIAQQIRDLYQRFLVRDPLPAEEAELLGLANDPALGDEKASMFSQALCLAVGSQLEFLFF